MSTSGSENYKEGKALPDAADQTWTSGSQDAPLEGSELTQSVDTGSLSEDDASGWLGAIGTDFRSIATCFKDSTLPVIGGVASFVHNTAMSVAAEIAELERTTELDAAALDHDRDPRPESSQESLSLPFELQQDAFGDGIPVYVTDQELMEEILALSLQETTFTTPYSAAGDSVDGDDTPFVMNNARISVIRRLLDIDKNLAARHSLLSEHGNPSDTTFWRNYFFHCERTRRELLERRKLKSDDQTSNTPGLGVPRESQEETTPSREGTDLESSKVDDESLVAASVEDDASYVLPSAPTSHDTFRSEGDLVFVGRDGGERHS